MLPETLDLTKLKLLPLQNPGTAGAVRLTIKSMNQSFYLFRFRGIPIKAHWTLPLFLAFQIFRNSDPQAFRFNLAFALILFITVIIHELGHALTARSVGGEAREIVLWPLGGLAYTSNLRTLQNSLKVTLGGPFTHIPLAALLAGVVYLVDGSLAWQTFTPFYSDMPYVRSMAAAYLVIAVKVQVILFLFNMCVPAYPLDCGHAIVELALIKGVKPENTAKFIIASSVLVSLVLILYFQLFFVGLFILYETWRLNQLRSAGALFQHPLFAMARNLRSAPRKKKSHLRVVKPAGRTCPHCEQSVPATARMCGRCERML